MPATMGRSSSRFLTSSVQRSLRIQILMWSPLYLQMANFICHEDIVVETFPVISSNRNFNRRFRSTHSMLSSDNAFVRPDKWLLQWPRNHRIPKSMNQKILNVFVFAGGGSLGAIQVGMLKALTAHDIQADCVVGSVDFRPEGPVQSLVAA